MRLSDLEDVVDLVGETALAELVRAQASLVGARRAAHDFILSKQALDKTGLIFHHALAKQIPRP